MTETTKSLIKDFQAYGDLRLLPGILIGMQEEDKVSEVIEFSNCFKKLRNIAAHEPDTLISQIQFFSNTGCQKLVIATRDHMVVTVDMVQFTAWMLNMYQLKEEFFYIIFLDTFMKLIYTRAIERMQDVEGNKSFVFNQTPLKDYLNWTSYMYKEFGFIYPIADTDPYILKIYREDQKLFWRIAYPDMMLLVIFFMSNRVSFSNKSNIDYFLWIFKKKEGLI